MQASITSRYFALRTPHVDAGFLLGAAVAVLLLIYGVLLPLGWPANSQMSGGPGGQALDAAAFAVVGLLIVRRQPGTSIGLMMTGSAVLLLVSADAQLYLLSTTTFAVAGCPWGALPPRCPRCGPAPSRSHPR